MKANWLLVLLGIVILFALIVGLIDGFHNSKVREKEFQDFLSSQPIDSSWTAPSLFIDRATIGLERARVIYGKELIAHTSKYLGPNGSVSKITNGMNCQNCHLDAGTRAWGNNFGAVYPMYPQMSRRSNSIQTIYDRVNDCLRRSLNGEGIDTNSYEMQSIYSYLKWLGKGLPKGKKPIGAGLQALPLINRAADENKGLTVYRTLCQSCHGAEGKGILNQTRDEYIYPPLWGENSYNDAAGLYRLGSFAAYVKNNMPYNLASHADPKLSVDEAWDVAAYVNSRPRPHMKQDKDWPDLKKKIFDFPFGPYADGFSEREHKYGPFQKIIDFQKINKLK
jgi:thiosulfate dehydrogenase